MTRTKKALIGLLLIGALASIGVGTYATFTASVTNNNTFQAGTLYLSTQQNTTSTGTLCFSYGTVTSGAFTSNANAACTNNVSLSAFKPGGTAQTFVVQVNNAGTLPADVSFAGSCAVGTGTQNTTVNGGATTAQICGDFDLLIAPCTAYTSGATCTKSTTACTYPNQASACPGTPANSASGLPGTTLVHSNMAPAATDNYEIDILLNSAATNVDMGMAAVIGLTWSSVPH